MRLTAIQQLFFKEQAEAGTYGFTTDPSAAEYLEMFDVSPPKPAGETLERSGNARGSHTPLPARPGPRKYELTASTDLIVPTTAALLATYVGTGSGATPFAELLRACDLVGTYTSATNVSFTPSSGYGTLLSIWHHLHGLDYKAIDCKPSFVLNAEAGGLCRFNFTFNGRYYDVATGDAIDADLDGFANAHIAQSASTISLAIGGAAAVDIDLAKMELNWNPTLKTRKSHRGQYGLGETIITNRAPTMALTVEMTDALDVALLAGWEALSSVVLTYQTAATAPYFKLVAKGQMVQAPVEDEEGEARHAVELRLSADAIEDELSLQWVSGA